MSSTKLFSYVSMLLFIVAALLYTVPVSTVHADDGGTCVQTKTCQQCFFNSNGTCCVLTSCNDGTNQLSCGQCIITQVKSSRQDVVARRAKGRKRDAQNGKDEPILLARLSFRDNDLVRAIRALR